jgi:enoyl-CoA hydratase
MPGNVTLAFDRGIAVVTIENHGRLNAMDDVVAAGLAAAVAKARAAADVGALILRGAGRAAFCSGVDLKFVAAHGDRAAAFARVGTGVDAFLAAMAELPFPSIAMVHGVCYGGGLHLAIAADFRFADTATRMVVPAVKNKLFYPIPALERLMRLIGPSRTRRIILEGEPLAPEVLLGWGLVDELHPPDQLEEATFAFARRLAAQPRAIVPGYMKILRALEAGDGEGARRLRDEARRAPPVG